MRVNDVTDATFATAVIERSKSVPVVVDLAKVDIDTNPEIAQAFQVQSIPAVFALKDGQIVDTFVGALPEAALREFVERLAPGASLVDQLVEAGDEASLREALER